MPINWLLQVGTGFLLDIAVMLLLARGLLRRFPLVFAFCLIQALFTCIYALFLWRFGARSPYYFRVFWTGDLLAHLCIGLLIAALIRTALDGRPFQNRAFIALVLAMLCFAAASLYASRDSRFNRWMTHVSRNLSLGEEVLNLALWTLLLRKRDYDTQLVIVSAGIGFQVTGEVIGHTLRPYTTSSTVWAANLLIFLSEIACLIMWLWAFRLPHNQRVSGENAAD